VQSLLGSWTEIALRVHQARWVALFLDFDGTLAPITAQPQDAFPARGSRGVLLRLSEIPRVSVCVISGRRRADVLARVGVPGVQYLGVHGWDTGEHDVSAELLQFVAEARNELAARLNGAAGVLIEDKGVSFALHHRGADETTVATARELLDEMLARHSGTFRAIHGDRVWEVLPREVRGKGHAALRQWRRWGIDALPIYLGNDATDEPAFQALACGVTARVGWTRHSRARYWLRDPSEVRRFLEALEAQMR
jgi:trehalose-phosphatase